jgi:hypothetical protein
MVGLSADDSGRCCYAGAVRGCELTLIAIASSALLGCPDDCKSKPPSFQLDISSGTGASSLSVEIAFAGNTYVRTYELAGNLDDGSTSIAVELIPAPANPFQLDVDITAYSGLSATGRVIGGGQAHLEGSPDGCNRFAIELEPRNGPPGDAGVDDTGVINPQDGGGPNVCDPICLEADCALSCSGSCPSCSLSCNNAANSCTPSCNGGETCAIFCVNTGNCDVECKSGSSCLIDCGSTPQCTARCIGSASCMLDCRDALACAYGQCSGGQTVCPDGKIACNRACN